MLLGEEVNNEFPDKLVYPSNNESLCMKKESGDASFFLEQTFVPTFKVRYDAVSTSEVIITKHPPSVIGKRTLIIPATSELPKDTNVLKLPKVSIYQDTN